MSEKEKISLDGKIKNYIYLPFYFLAFWIVLSFVCFYIDLRAGIIMSAATVIYFIVSLVFCIKYRPRFMKDLVEFGADYSQIQKQMLNDLDVPFGLLDETGRILWANNMLEDVVKGENISNKNVISIFDKFDGSNIKFDESGRNEFMMAYGDREYKVVLKALSLDPEKNKHDDVAVDMIGLYLFDYSYISQLEKENADEK